MQKASSWDTVITKRTGFRYSFVSDMDCLIQTFTYDNLKIERNSHCKGDANGFDVQLQVGNLRSTKGQTVGSLLSRRGAEFIRKTR